MAGVHACVWSIGVCKAVMPSQLSPPPHACLPQAWEHIKGREGQALETLKRIAAETAAERQQKEVAEAVREAAAMHWVSLTSA